MNTTTPSAKEYQNDGAELELQLQRRKKMHQTLWGPTAEAAATAAAAQTHTPHKPMSVTPSNTVVAGGSMGFLRDLENCDRVGKAMFSTMVGSITTTSCCPPPTSPQAGTIEQQSSGSNFLINNDVFSNDDQETKGSDWNVASQQQGDTTPEGRGTIPVNDVIADDVDSDVDSLDDIRKFQHDATRLAENVSTTVEVRFLSDDELQREKEKRMTSEAPQPAAVDFPTHEFYLCCSTDQQRRELSIEAEKLQNSYKVISPEERRKRRESQGVVTILDPAGQSSSSPSSPAIVTSPFRRRESKRKSLEVSAYRPMDVLADVDQDLQRKKRVLEEYQRYRERHNM